MCEAAAIGIGVGVLSGVAGMSKAQTEADYQNAIADQKYKVAVENTKRENQIASQQYQNQLRIAGETDKAKAKPSTNSNHWR